MSEKAYNPTRIEAAVVAFQSVELTGAEALLASARLLQESLTAFRKLAPAFRAEIGEDATRSFATEELNDLIYELQDSIQPLLKTYNSLLRDPEGAAGPLE